LGQRSSFADCVVRVSIFARIRRGLIAVAVLPSLFGAMAFAGPKPADHEAAVTGSAALHADDADLSPWGIASGAEWLGDHPRFNPRLREAGVRWLRAFYEWADVQPARGVWRWQTNDRLVANSRANGIRLAGFLGFLANWASADGSTRTFPIRDMQHWRDYVSAVITRYHKHIKYWEVWNEFNSPGFAAGGTPEIYANLVRETYTIAKSIDPDVKIGLSVANFDVRFLDAAIKAGAANHFDYICIHPYENLGALPENGEAGFLSMAGKLRAMLAANGQSADLPIWISEFGLLVSETPDEVSDEAQAVALAKGFILALASGFQRVFWFEARGPLYGEKQDLGILRADWSPRPAFETLKALTAALGEHPVYLGWLDLDQGGYGFLFRAGERTVLAAWAPPTPSRKIRFAEDLDVVDLKGAKTLLRAGEDLTLTSAPLLIMDVPAALVVEAQGNIGKPLPWGREYADAESVVCRLGPKNVDLGLQQVNAQANPAFESGDESWRKIDFSRAKSEGRYAYFRVDPAFAPYATREFEVTAVVRRIEPEKAAGMTLFYESVKGYVSVEYRGIPADAGWHELTWTVKDADFVGAWAWNFGLNAISSPNEFYIKEVRVKKLQRLLSQ
jgi:hypothetical protein